VVGGGIPDAVGAASGALGAALDVAWALEVVSTLAVADDAPLSARSADLGHPMRTAQRS
jgi:hypothetical protein